MTLDFRTFPLWANVLLLAIGGGFVWIAGARLTSYTDALAEKTGISRAFLGALMLGGLTSLPEIAATLSATAIGNAHLAVNNLIGGVAMQVAILGLADAAAGGVALSAAVRDPSLRRQGLLLIALLGLVIAAIVVGEPSGFRVGVFAMAIVAGAIGAFYLVYRWGSATPVDAGAEARRPEQRKRSLLLRSALSGLVIFVAGYVVARSGDAIGEQSRLGASFVGVIFVAITTSLPEVSTTISAARMGKYDLVFSNIFGTNIFDVSILGLVDLLWAKGPVLNEVGTFSVYATALGITLTAVYVLALTKRSHRRYLRMGIDSLAVLGIYALGLLLLYRLRGE